MSSQLAKCVSNEYGLTNLTTLAFIHASHTTDDEEFLTQIHGTRTLVAKRNFQRYQSTTSENGVAKVILADLCEFFLNRYRKTYMNSLPVQREKAMIDLIQCSMTTE